MRKAILFLLFVVVFATSALTGHAQCSVCTRTAAQLGEKPAQGLNAGVLYLATAPLLIAGFIAYKWLRGNDVSNK